MSTDRTNFFIIGLVDGCELFYVDTTRNPERRLQQLHTKAGMSAPRPVLARVKAAKNAGTLSLVVLQKRTEPTRRYDWVQFLSERGLKLMNETGSIQERTLHLLRTEPLLSAPDIARVVGYSRQRVNQIMQDEMGLEEARRKAKAAYLKALGLS